MSRLDPSVDTAGQPCSTSGPSCRPWSTMNTACQHSAPGPQYIQLACMLPLVHSISSLQHACCPWSIVHTACQYSAPGPQYIQLACMLPLVRYGYILLASMPPLVKTSSQVNYGNYCKTHFRLLCTLHTVWSKVTVLSLAHFFSPSLSHSPPLSLSLSPIVSPSPPSTRRCLRVNARNTLQTFSCPVSRMRH